MRNGYPLIDLHRHLEGCVRPETIIELGLQYKLPLPAWTVHDLLPYIQVTSPVPNVMVYIAKFELMQLCMVNFDAIRRITYECIEDASCEGLDYVEMRFSPVFMAEKHSLDLFGVVDAVCDGLEEAMRTLPIHAKLIGVMSRTYGVDSCWKELHAVMRGRERGIVAVDVAGDEIKFPAQLFIEHFLEAHDAGLRITVHAGESTSAEQVKCAILELGAERLGHAVRAIDDPAVMELIAERTVGIESCPTSNIQTGVVASYRQHPLPAYLHKGLLVTLNTDATVVSGIQLLDEYQVAEKDMELAEKDLQHLQRNAVSVAFLLDDERANLLSRILPPER